MDRGRHCHEVHEVIFDAAVLRFGYPVGNPKIAWGLGNHLSTLISRYDLPEVSGQVRRSLAVARCAVPSNVALSHDRRQELEEIIGVGGAEVSILRA